MALLLFFFGDEVAIGEEAAAAAPAAAFAFLFRKATLLMDRFRRRAETVVPADNGRACLARSCFSFFDALQPFSQSSSSLFVILESFDTVRRS